MGYNPPCSCTGSVLWVVVMWVAGVLISRWDDAPDDV